MFFSDGSVQQYTANTIAENIYSQIDEDGRRYQLIDYIMDHKSDGRAVKQQDAFILVSRNGKKTRRHTTKGWHFQVQWKDGLDSWVPLRDLKESHPVGVVEYVRSPGIEDEPAFAWWVPFALSRREIRLSLRSHLG